MHSPEYIADERFCPVCSSIITRSFPALLDPFIVKRCNIDPELPVYTNFCGSCHYCFRTPFLSEESLERLYKGYRDATYNRLRVSVEPGYSKQVDMLADISHPYWKERAQFYDFAHSDRRGWGGVVVDFGGGDGFFSRQTFPEADIRVVEEDFERKGGNLDELLSGTGLLFSAQVFEHIPQPVAKLRRLAKSLLAGSLAWIDIPNDFEGPPGEEFARLQAEQAAGVLGWTSSVAIYHEHVGNFSPRSLRVLFRRSGFQIEEMVMTPKTIGILGRRTSEPTESLD